MSDALPNGWVLTTIGDVAVVNPPGSTVSGPDELLVTFLPMAAVEELTGRIDASDIRSFGAVKKGFTRFQDGDVLVAKITPSMENGKVAVVRDLTNGKGCGSTEFHVVRARKGVVADYLRYFLVRSAFRQEAKRNMQGAVGQQRVPANFLRDAALPMPSAKQQSRIVSKIDELFSRIEEGERALERVQKLVERYRQSVLKAAVTGELTRAWREQRKGQLESGEALLKRILKARRAAWEQAELGKLKAKGVRPADDKWKLKYVEPATPATSDLPALPEGWTWATLEQLSTLITSGSRGWKEYYAGTGSLFIRAQNIKHDCLDLEEIAFVDLSGVTEGVRTKVSKEDLLITITGANVTKAAHVSIELEDAYVSQHVALVRPVLTGLSDFIFDWIISPANGRRYLKEAAYGAGKPGLSLEDLRAIPVALPSLEEQRAIGDIVEVEWSRMSSAEADVVQNQRAATLLRQTVLRAAFSGELVCQGESKESASILPTRVFAEADAAIGSRRRRKKSAA
jgi:type I restriction enzyme, S subunit